MDYESAIAYSYEISVSELANNNFLYLYNDGSYELVNDTDFVESQYSNLNNLMGYVANYHNRVLSSSINRSPVSIAYNFGASSIYGDLLFMNTNRLDYLIFGSSNGGNELYGYRSAEGDTIDDLTSINNYYKYGSRENIADVGGEDNNYGSFYVTNFTYCVFDYTNIKYEELESPLFTARGENITFYQYVTEFYYSANSQSVYISYGNPTNSQWNSGFQSGLSNGYADGRLDGYHDGYIDGKNSVGNVNNATANAFDYIGNAFGAVSDIMSLEVLPNITLGTAFTIPMVFVLIMTIFKLVRK